MQGYTQLVLQVPYMWPATGPGDDSARSLAQDDIDAVCELYPSGGEVPVAPEDPEPPSVGMVPFGEDCSTENCASGLFCVSDGMQQYCSQSCAERQRSG